MTNVELPRESCRCGDWIAFAMPVVLVVAFFVIYLISPQFYLSYILEFSNREKQAVEILTWTSALCAALILFVCGFWQWKKSSSAPGGSWLPGGALFMLMVGLAAFFMGGEEISWGQTWFHWKTPDDMKLVSRETNLHNGHLGLSVHLLGNLFVIGMFIALPLVWRFRRLLWYPLPADWRPAIAEWPVGMCTLLALLMRTPKQFFMRTHTAAELAASPFYVGYLEEIGEQKEMLVAIAMLIYAIYRIRAVRAQRRSATLMS